MNLPNARHAFVERSKIVEYLLNAAHPDNGGKAAFFLSLGFSSERWETLAEALRKLAEDALVADRLESPHGVKYIVDGEIGTPGGTGAGVRTIWVVDRGADAPRFVTAYPRRAEDWV
jgi:hypothetical protein